MTAEESNSVFINAPFDARYEPLFVTLVGSLVFLSQIPRCVLEIREAGQGRLARVIDLIRSCRISLHDVSRIGTPARFNMPFELGLACAISHTSGNHDVFVLDSAPYRMDRTLSDYKGRDPLIHHNRCDDLVSALIDVFEPKADIPVHDLRKAARALRQTARDLKQEFRSATVFRAAIYRRIVEAATKLAAKRQLIAP